MGTNAEYLKTLDVGLDAVEGKPAPTSKVQDTLKLSTGVVLKLRTVAPRIVVQVLQRFERPKIPVIYDEDKGRSIENPQHPDYLKAMEQFQSDQGFALFDACIALGTEFLSAPASVAKIEDSSWVDDLEAAGEFFDASRIRIRYVMWVKAVAAVSESDLSEIVRSVLRRAGVTQEDVVVALESFPGQTK